MKKLSLAIALCTLLSSTVLADPSSVVVDTWPGIGSNRQVDSLRCYALVFAPADQQRVSFSCQNGNCTARVTVPFLFGYTTLRTSAPYGSSKFTVKAGDGQGSVWMADIFTDGTGDTIISHFGNPGPGKTPIGQCTYPSVAPVGKVARRVGDI